MILQGEGGDDDVGGGLSTGDVDGDGLDDLFIGGGGDDDGGDDASGCSGQWASTRCTPTTSCWLGSMRRPGSCARS